METHSVSNIWGGCIQCTVVVLSYRILKPQLYYAIIFWEMEKRGKTNPVFAYFIVAICHHTRIATDIWMFKCAFIWAFSFLFLTLVESFGRLLLFGNRISFGPFFINIVMFIARLRSCIRFIKIFYITIINPIFLFLLFILLCAWIYDIKTYHVSIT